MNIKKLVIVVALLLLLAGGGFSWYVYRQLNNPIVVLGGKASEIVYIPSGSDFEDVVNIFTKDSIINNPELFKRVAEIKKYPSMVKAGKYRIDDGMNVNELVNLLRSGRQQPVRFTFNNIRFVDKLAGLAASKLELDSAGLAQLFHDNEYLKQFGFNEQTLVAMFIPNTYEFFWNTSADAFMQRMYKEYKKFWNKKRLEQAKAIGLSPLEVSILASIVQEETNKTDEMSRIAGVYINRLHKGMLLQADPTARFAYGDFSIKRVTYDYLKTDSPYNTYLYPGLPPGPICMPDPQTIDRVLNYEKHNYLFFCARPDNTGYHNFARSNAEHARNARAYHNYLNRQRIR